MLYIRISIGKVWIGEFAKVLTRSNVIGVRGLNFRCETSQKNKFLVCMNCSSPFIIFPIPNDPYIARTSAHSLLLVPMILDLCCLSKIAATIIQFVPIDMIYLHITWGRGYKAVHVYVLSYAVYFVMCVRISTRKVVPVPLHQPVVIASADYCVFLWCA